MIRYNANSPEILGKKQYDVLQGFGWWCLMYGLCSTNFALFLLSEVLSKDPLIFPQITDLLLAIGFFAFCIITAIYSFVLGLGTLTRWLYTPTCARFGYIPILNIALIGILLVLFIQNVKYMPSFVAVFMAIYVLVLCLNAICFMLGVIKTYQQECIAQWFAGHVTETGTISTDNSEPVLHSAFENWDPLKFYGLFWKIFGVVTTLVILINVLTNLSNSANIIRDLKYYLIFPFPFVAVLIVSAFIGHGLSKQKEWARMLAIFQHCAIILLICFAIFLMIEQNAFRYVQWPGTLALLLLLTIAHWCYFVIRTLSSPVVKYVCLRGGHDID